MTSPQQSYSSFQYNNNLIDDINNTLAGNINVESYHSLIDDEDIDLFNACIDNGNDGHLDNTYDDENGVHDEGLVDDKEELPDFQNEQQLPWSCLVIAMPHSNGVTIDPLISMYQFFFKLNCSKFY